MLGEERGECRAHGEGERRGRREEKKEEKEKEKKKNRKKKRKKRKEGRENKEREGERFAPVTRRLVSHARRRACVGATRGSRVNRVLDSVVGVRSFRDREIGQNRESSRIIRVRALGENLSSTTETRF